MGVDICIHLYYKYHNQGNKCLSPPKVSPPFFVRAQDGIYPLTKKFSTQYSIVNDRHGAVQICRIYSSWITVMT